MWNKEDDLQLRRLCCSIFNVHIQIVTLVIFKIREKCKNRKNIKINIKQTKNLNNNTLPKGVLGRRFDLQRLMKIL